MSPLGPGVGGAAPWPGTSNPPIDRGVVLCGLSSGASGARGCASLYAPADVVFEKSVYVGASMQATNLLWTKPALVNGCPWTTGAVLSHVVTFLLSFWTFAW